ncbi:hypothetical protein BCR44DRAFT_286476 [Catenaria anguillulae PL171]|uniref:Uncharacterized protein n=1 Tax=Catenaria anguillulae PL171 TaxID=765915 RepID=A0A1Y2HRT4_9FUNG|nr:hypothetical protein BCR44DRAFT_286476 [Catenaria anguillulae PL171]
MEWTLVLRPTKAKADSDSPYCPFSKRLDAILHVICSTDPTLTRCHVQAFLWALREAGVKDVPSYVCSLRDLVPMPVIKSAKCISGRAGLFSFRPVSETVKLFAVDPSVYPHLATLPRRVGGAVHDFTDTPRARKLFESFRVANISHGGHLFFVADFVEWRDPATGATRLARAPSAPAWTSWGRTRVKSMSHCASASG